MRVSKVIGRQPQIRRDLTQSRTLSETFQPINTIPASLHGYQLSNSLGVEPVGLTSWLGPPLWETLSITHIHKHAHTHTTQKILSLTRLCLIKSLCVDAKVRKWGQAAESISLVINSQSHSSQMSLWSHNSLIWRWYVVFVVVLLYQDALYFEFKKQNSWTLVP